ncbi:PiggyBac transposable element-derived protein 4 [Eumeta japonica]|uniref:PiggyBac transposable element-derived protein 4 n=1 Tax=Eumeta variegata TaxID=151549 RepID=A0A4C1W5A4_EUMVA|nr:PiggyBac transposable element-derived protein 4 [Eumeta japonica]
MEKFLSDEQIANMLDHWDSEDEFDLAVPTNFESEYEDSASEHSSHRSDTEMELDSHDESNASSDDEVPFSHLGSYTGKNGFKWSKIPPPASRTRAHNLIRHLPGIKGQALSNDNLNPLECWEVIFTKDIIDMKNKRELPKEFLPSKVRTEDSSNYGFTSDKTIVSYVPKKNQSVVLISSMHHEMESDPLTEKPEIIVFYNSTKGGVDSLDQKCTIFSVMRRTRRWPMVIFGTMMNISTVNSHVIWKASNPDGKMKRRDFIKDLGLSLIRPQIIKRKQQSATLSRELHGKIENFLGPSTSRSENADEPPSKRAKSGRCYICSRKDDRKYTKYCHKCEKFVCKNHYKDKVECIQCCQNK